MGRRTKSFRTLLHDTQRRARLPLRCLEAQDYQIVIRSTKPPRQNWEVAFRAMAERGHDAYSTDLC
jgi:hypothetical protein